jgi:hypothetical protein
MSWPTSTTPTTYVDADTDPIWRARPHIKQDIENVNAIIDTFDPSTPSGGSISGEVAKLVDESDYADPDDNNIGAMPDIGDIAFSPDGTKMFVVGSNNTVHGIQNYSLSTGFDTTTKTGGTTQTPYNFDSSAYNKDAKGIAFNTDGTKMFLLGDSDDAGDPVIEYHLSTGFDLSTASYDSSFDVSAQQQDPQSIRFSNDGKKMFILGGSGTDQDRVFQYSLTTGFDVSTASYDSVSFDVSTQDSNPKGIAFTSDGLKMFLVGHSNNKLFVYTMTTAFDISSMSHASSDILDGFFLTGPMSPPSDPLTDRHNAGISISADDTKFFIVNSSTGEVEEYHITQPIFPGARLLYNSSTTKFTTSTQTDKCQISFDSTMAHNPFIDSAYDEQGDFYTGGLTIENTNLTGITVGTNTYGHSEITFPQGSYAIELVGRQSIGNDSFLVNYKEDDTTTHFTSSSARTGTQGSNAVTEFFYKVVVTFSSDTTVGLRYVVNSASGSSIQHQDILITRIA